VDRVYKGLNLNRAIIEELTNSCIKLNGFVLDKFEAMPGAHKGVRIIFGVTGQEFATVDILFSKDGRSTVQYKTGKNPKVGKVLADSFFESIDPTELEQVNMVVKGLTRQTVSDVLEMTAGLEHIEVNVDTDEPNKVVWKVSSAEYQDSLTVTLHVNTRNLQIQGRPLSCYKAFVFELSGALDLKGLEQVLIRKDDGNAEIVQQEVAVSYLKAVFGDSYPNQHQVVEKLLISGLCVKLAAPKLPDYSMLLYPELRSIEGALKHFMGEVGIGVGRDGFGAFFTKESKGFDLKPEYLDLFTKPEVAKIISDAYTFLNTERHGLFHMDVVVDASRVISSMTHLMTKSTQAWGHLKSLYGIQNV
jgi:hypothetical protein